MAAAVMGLWNKFMESHEWIMGLGDPRTQDWPLVRSPFYPLAFLVCFYMPLVVHGPSLMRPFKPIEAKKVMFFFNIFQVCYSVFMWTQFLYLAISMRYSLTCEPVNPSTDWQNMRMAACIWHFYFSKIIDLIDTLFFVLRKKERNISFLHVYHHSTQVFIWWIGIKFVPGGHSFFIGCVNSMIHSIMYTYYLIASLGEPYKKYLWWKKYLTGLQLVQFVMVVAHSVSPLVAPGCQFPKILAVISSTYTVSVFALFLNFYIVNYMRRPPSSSSSSSVVGKPFLPAANGGSKHLTNGSAVNGGGVAANGKQANGHHLLNGHHHLVAGGDGGDGNAPTEVRKRQVNGGGNGAVVANGDGSPERTRR